MSLKKLLIPASLAVIHFCSAFTVPSLSAQPESIRETLRDTVPDTASDEKLFVKVDIEASYPGGDNAWRRFLEQNLDAAVPVRKKAPAGYYTVIIQFVVDKTGNVSDIKPLTNHGYGMEDEVIRLLKKSPRWKPASQDSRPVKAYRKQPVTFMVIEEKRKNRRD